MSVTNFKGLTDLVFGNVFHKLKSAVDCHIGELYRDDLIRLDLA